MNFLNFCISPSFPQPLTLPCLPSFNPPEVLPKVQNFNAKEEFSKFAKNFKPLLNPASKSQLETTSKNSSKKPEKSLNFDFLSPFKKSSEFKLKLKTSLESPLCKCKYFTFKVFLERTGNADLPVNQQVDLEVLVFSQDGVLITKNMRGQEILKGNSLQTMNFFVAENSHAAYFRIQVTEVSSHFVGKRVDLKVRARSSEFLMNMGWKIKSLYLRGIVFKAKRRGKKESI